MNLNGLNKRLEAIEREVKFIRENDIKHLWLGMKIIIGIMSSIFLTLWAGFIAMLVK